MFWKFYAYAYLDTDLRKFCTNEIDYISLHNTDLRKFDTNKIDYISFRRVIKMVQAQHMTAALAQLWGSIVLLIMLTQVMWLVYNCLAPRPIRRTLKRSHRFHRAWPQTLAHGHRGAHASWDSLNLCQGLGLPRLYLHLGGPSWQTSLYLGLHLSHSQEPVDLGLT